MDETLYAQAQHLLVPIWRGIPSSYKRHYRRTIWQQFEDNLRSAAYTSSLSKMLSTLCARLGVEVHRETVASVMAIIQSGLDTPLRKMLRDEAVTCVLLVRLEHEQRQSVWEAQQRAEVLALAPAGLEVPDGPGDL